MHKSPVVLLLLSISALPSFGQTSASEVAQTTPTAAPATYDVVSIKLDKTARNSKGVDVQGDIYHAGNLSLKELIAGAYGISPDLISSIPDSLDSARFDLDAKVVDSDPDALKKLSPEQRAAMLRPVLADRFALKAHVETKTLPIFDLVVAHGGPKLKTTARAKAERNSSISIHGTELIMRGVSMTKLAGTLTDMVHRKVTDKTGLTDTYDFTLKWSRDDSQEAQVDSAPDIFTALEEQLGLKLQPSKGPVDTLVIDHVEMPTQN